MDFSQIRLLLGLLQEAGIPDLELCVPADDLGAAKSVFESQEGLLEIEDKTNRELLDSFSPDKIATLPFPRFTPLFRGFCRSYIETQEATAAMAAECLVDGMNINEEWCHAHFDPPESAESGFALRLVNSRGSRIDDFSLNQVTCFIPDLQEAQRLQRIPGFYE
ncbi:hypothetical protein RJZ56_001818 [Blastomyces dermatitidis]